MMETLTDEEQNSFISNLDNSLWFHWFLIVGDIIKFYSLQETKEALDVSQDFLISLLTHDEDNIELFRKKFKDYIEQNNGKFRQLGLFPEYFHPRDKKIRNIEVDVIRVKLLVEKEEGKRSKLLKRLNQIEELDNPEYKTLTKIEEAENCFFWAVNSLRTHYKKDKMRDFIGLPRAMFLHGYACGLLEIDGGVYTKLNEEISPQQKGGEVIKHKAQLAKMQLIELWEGRFNNPIFSPRAKKTKSQFASFMIENPNLIKDENGEMLAKSNGDQWYSEKKTITDILSAYDNSKKYKTP